MRKPRTPKVETPQDRLRAMAKVLDILEKLDSPRLSEATRRTVAERLRALAEELES